MPSGPPQGSGRYNISLIFILFNISNHLAIYTNLGIHRYTFLIYKQPGIQNFDSFPNSPPMSCLNRKNFNTRYFEILKN